MLLTFTNKKLDQFSCQSWKVLNMETVYLQLITAAIHRSQYFEYNGEYLSRLADLFNSGSSRLSCLPNMRWSQSVDAICVPQKRLSLSLLSES